MALNYTYKKKISIKKGILTFIFCIQLLFLLSAISVSLLSHLKASFLQNWSQTQSLTSFLYALETENHYFTQEFKKQTNSLNLSSTLFSLVTNIKLNDIPTFIKNELPGFSTYYSEIAVAGEGTNESNIPKEPNVSLEELTKQRDANLDATQKNQSENSTNNIQQKSVFIYHSHSRESFLPLLPGTTNPNAASSDKVNVSLLGDRLKMKLEEKGIGAINNKADIVDMLLNRGLNYPSSYNISREVVQEALAQNKDIQYLVDIHRDSSRKPLTTKTINGKSYGRLYFVVGKENKHFQQSLQFAKAINSYLDKNYYGISRGIFIKDRREGNGIYNQDLSPHAMLVEIGGVDNNLDELNRTVDILAEAIKDYYQKAEKVNKQQ
ncbi:stage II sporulation protein P [Bacillus cereus]|uniref:stage II sporulation protein P n=1 Tax=Bacillus cereus TaxID=1396 RepID=UPI002404F662|nr:stage II sporulation protein P [Bacillus cereus]MDF9478247.1 stage II sporulation protein P [Bacillus cereus]MDF9499868.1 stage II sporulation protein P [Bacillus cereus]MDF9517500.1 stage II sporulation protein P [Bacillus cereus]MDF9568957.1 stage II sporulation protein P [Bacillus cereus]